MLNNESLWALLILAGILAIIQFHSYHLIRENEIRSKNMEQELNYIEGKLDRMGETLNESSRTN